MTFRDVRESSAESVHPLLTDSIAEGNVRLWIRGSGDLAEAAAQQ